MLQTDGIWAIAACSVERRGRGQCKVTARCHKQTGLGMLSRKEREEGATGQSNTVRQGEGEITASFLAPLPKGSDKIKRNPENSTRWNQS